MNIYIFIIYPFDIHKPKRILLSILKDEMQKNINRSIFHDFPQCFVTYEMRNAAYNSNKDIRAVFVL